MGIAQTFQQIWSYELNNDTITIDSSFGLTIISFVLTSGDGSFQGSLSASGIPSSPITLVVGETVTLTGDNGFILNGITITTTGIVSIVGR